jgi:hypothetical protein
MLGTRKVQNSVIDSDQKILRFSFELAGKRRLAQVFNNVIAHQSPELPGRDPDTTCITQDFGRVFGGGRQTGTSFKALTGISKRSS